MPKSKNSLTLIEAMQAPGPVAPPAKPAPEALRPNTLGLGADPKAWARIEGHRLRFSLSTLGLASVIFAWAATVLVAYLLGASAGTGVEATLEPSSPADFSGLLSEAPDHTVLEDLRALESMVQPQQAHNEQDTGQPAGWVSGLNYIWVDQFHTLEASLSARHYLARHDIKTTLVPTHDEWVLVTNKGFDWSIAAQKASCLTLVERIKELGQAYLRTGGRYQFKCYARKLEGDTW